MMKTENEFYYGTSTEIKIGETLSSGIKGRKVQVTKDLEQAQTYAEIATKKYGGNPVIYIVEPDMKFLIRKNRHDFVTSEAKIVGVYKEEEN